MPSYGNRGHILMIPYPASGHMLPHMDLTHQLLLRGLTVTILVTPKNLHYLNPLLSLHSSSDNVQTLVMPFPSHSSIPSGVENMQDVPISFVPDFAAALSKLHDSLFQWFQSHPSPPVVIVADMLLNSWTTILASKLNIPNISFLVVNAKTVASWWVNDLEVMPDIFRELHLGCMRSWGFVFNSFTELDSESLKVIQEGFIKHDRIWAVGPLLPIKAISKGSAERGGPSSMPQDQVTAWLDSCDVDKSVIYVGFGTQITLTKEQMKAVATALEQSGIRFIWAVKDPMKGTLQEADDQSVVPMGFEERVAGRGLVIKGWAPQLAILGHRAVGSYLTHCGWNSALEAILAGVLLLAWPMQADHFENTKLLVDELEVAIRVCEGLESVPDVTKLARILSQSSVDMGRPERVQAMKLRTTAFDAIKEGGTSFKALDGLVEELSSLGSMKKRAPVQGTN